ncbi:hypothetical protein STEG23_023331 [Scotinomys teguina]
MDTLAPMVSFPILIIKEHSITEWCNAKEHKREEKSRPNEEGKKAEDRGPRCQCCLSTDMEPAYPMETKPPSAVAACRRAMSSEDFRFSSVIRSALNGGRTISAGFHGKGPPSLGFTVSILWLWYLLTCLPSMWTLSTGQGPDPLMVSLASPFQTAPEGVSSSDPEAGNTEHHHTVPCE